MKINRIFFVFGFIFFILLACDKIEEPYFEYNGECGDASLPVPIKQILIEEFTGHKCGNCPEGDATMEMLKEIYCDHIIPVSIHAGFFAEINTSGDKYTYDYRTEEGTEIDEYFGGSAAGLPNAMINRIPENESYSYNPSEWATMIAKLLETKPIIDIDVELSFDAQSREMDADIDVVFIEAINDNLMLSVYFVEDSIVSWQKDYELNPSDIENYSHNHVLRDAINGTWGDNLLNGNANSDDVVSKSYNYTINPEWDINNSSIVAFVYKNNTKEVIQATQKYLMP